MNRDEELDKLQRELGGAATPYIHRPEELDLRDGTLCFLDGHRVCGPDCVAYDPEYADQPPQQCVLLQAQLTTIAASRKQAEVARKRIQQLQDAERHAATFPPPPGIDFMKDKP